MRDKPGLFEEADGGTLFLDEIGELPLAAAGEAPARAAGGRDPPGRRHRVDQGRRAGDRGDAARSRRRRARRAGSARTCSTGSTCCRCRCRRCASAPRTSRCSRGSSRERHAARHAARRGRAVRRRDRGAAPAAVAGQRARARERDRAGAWCSPTAPRSTLAYLIERVPRPSRPYVPRSVTGDADELSIKKATRDARAGPDPARARRDQGQSHERGQAARDQPPRAALQDQGVRHHAESPRSAWADRPIDGPDQVFGNPRGTAYDVSHGVPGVTGARQGSMAKQCIGLDIGSSSVKAVQLRRKGSGWALQAFGMQPLVPQTIVDGTIMDQGAVVEAIRQLWSRLKLKQKEVAIAIAGHSVIIKKISVPPDDRRSSSPTNIRCEAEHHIPFGRDDVEIDYHVTNPANASGQTELLLVAAKKEVVVGLRAGRARREPVADGRRRRGVREPERLRGQLPARSARDDRPHQHRRGDLEHQHRAQRRVAVHPRRDDRRQRVHRGDPEAARDRRRRGRGLQGRRHPDRGRRRAAGGRADHGRACRR